MVGRFRYPSFSVGVAVFLSSMWEPKLASDTVMDMNPGLGGIVDCRDAERCRTSDVPRIRCALLEVSSGREGLSGPEAIDGAGRASRSSFLGRERRGRGKENFLGARSPRAMMVEDWWLWCRRGRDSG